MNSKYGSGNECKAASSVLKNVITDCDLCPFPFCVESEADLLLFELREQFAKAMHQLGVSADEIARTLGISLRSAYRYTNSQTSYDCAQCKIVHSSNIMLKSSLLTLVKDNDSYQVLLNRHGQATTTEKSGLLVFVDYVFPDSRVVTNVGAHEFLTISNIDQSDVKKLQWMCDNLVAYNGIKIHSSVP